MAHQIKPILIVGAGIAGPTLAQACRKENLPFRIFEREPSASHRRAGWGLTLHWSLPKFRSLLPEDLLARLPETYVNKEAVDAGEKGSFTYFDLSTGEPKWQVPAAERIRVSRERLRSLLLEGLDVEWSKNLIEVRKQNQNSITALFADGTKVEGCILVACDGANSQVRQLCHPKTYRNELLPVRFLGTGVHYSESQISSIKKLDPYFLQGSDPRTDSFLWFSFVNAPSDPNSSEGKDDKYYCQIVTTWPYRHGFLGRKGPVEMPETREEQLAWMKEMSADWVQPFKDIVHNISLEDEIQPIYLADWLPRRTTAFAGRVVLIGDAAHAMVMYRGEGANHAIVDISNLFTHVRPLVGAHNDDDQAWKEAAEEYEKEMIERTEIAVLASRQACLDAHDWTRLNERSPLVRRRLVRADLE